MLRFSPLLLTTFALGFAPSASAQGDWYSQEGQPPPPPGGYESSYATGTEEPSRDQQGPTGLGIAMRLDVGLPFGKIADEEGADLSNFVTSSINTQFDLNYAITPSVVLGGYFGLGVGLENDKYTGCDEDDVDCSTMFLRTGVNGEYRILPDKFLDPWVGANAGLEWAFQSFDTPAGDASISYFGLLFGASAGLDFRLKRWGLGPFASFQTGPYFSGDVSGDSFSASGEIEERAFHHWLHFGVRARYQFAR